MCAGQQDVLSDSFTPPVCVFYDFFTIENKLDV